MDEFEQVLTRLDPPTADRVRPVLDLLFGEPGHRTPLSDLHQLGLQHFLWIRLPDAWFVDELEHHEIAWSFGDFLAAAGLQRYAAICRSQRTHEILSTWHVDPDEGARVAREAQQTSGVLPPDTGTLTFGSQTGNQEERTLTRVSRLLEDLIVRGELDPGSPRFKNQSLQAVETFLRTPTATYDGMAPAAVVQRERAALWAHRLSSRLRGFWDETLPMLEKAATVPPNVQLALGPVTAVLEAVRDGVTLTSAGYLPPKVAVALDDRFAWSEEYLRKTPRGEGDLPPLQWLHQHLREQRLLTKRGNRLTVSVEGRRALDDPLRLWRAVVAPSPRWRPGFEHDTLGLMAALLLADGSFSSDGLREELRRVLALKWRPPSGASLDEGITWVQLDWYRLGIVLGWWSDSRRHILSESGRAAATSLFWAVATQPQERRLHQ